MKIDMRDPEGGVFTVAGFMTPEECQAYIHFSESLQFAPAPLTTAHGPVMAPEVRNNTRVMVDDHRLAQSMWERVRPLVPEALFDWSDELREPIGLNERFRYFRYDPEQRFARHYDAPYSRQNGEASLLTFMVYLNEGFEGGETRFYTDHSELRFAVKPQTGMALFFIHNLYHEGARVLSGRKYVLRSDVMYRRLGWSSSKIS